MKNIKVYLLPFFMFLSFTGKAQEVAEDNRTLIRVLSYNILHGATTNRDNDLDVVAEAILKAEPDVAALQEVDYRTNRADRLDVTAEIAKRTNMVSIFAKAVDWDGGEYGQALLSKYTFLKTGKLDLPTHKGNEPRIAIESLLILPSGDTIRLIGTHLDHQKDSTERIEQAEELNVKFLKDNIPTILAGDINDIPGSETLKILESRWGSSYDPKEPIPTFPSHAPERKIDYVMFSPKERWKVVERQVLCDKVASDHCAVLVVLELLPQSK
ncbi:MAG TPA: endonuclease/exonuclease/phosphatase family protein, partial [Gillisia sp.]|nr:endonuclease/exonuclease/phosphatase family protein [Gillisia sp.]